LADVHLFGKSASMHTGAYQTKQKKALVVIKKHTEGLESFYAEIMDFKCFLNLEILRLAHA
jgi:hypothetical protein